LLLFAKNIAMFENIPKIGYFLLLLFLPYYIRCFFWLFKEN